MSVSLEEYFRTTFEDKLLVKMPEREDDHLTPATRLLEKRREMAEVEQALGAQKEEFQMKMESLQQRREELERKEFQLKESLLKFDKFLKENDSKRARAVKKAQDEKDLKRIKDKEIQRLLEEKQEAQGVKDKLIGRLNKHKLYHKFLEKTLETADEFQEIREIIARYETLVATHTDLLDKSHKTQDLVEKEKGRLLKFTEERNNEIMQYNNQLASLQTRLDKAQSEAVKWESVWTHIKNTAAKKTLLLGRVNMESVWTHIKTTAAKKTLMLGRTKMATHNLFQLVNRHLKAQSGQEIATDNTTEQLHKKATEETGVGKHSIQGHLEQSKRKGRLRMNIRLHEQEINTIGKLDKIQIFIMDLTQITTEIKRAEAAVNSQQQQQQQQQANQAATIASS